MSAKSLSTVALIVTSNSARWIEQTLVSIVGQEHQPDAIVVIDDNSTDNTRSIIHAVLGGRASVYRATSRAEDVTTRIAHNFHQGVRACAKYDVAILGDHDDRWYPTRVGHQLRQLATHPEMTMVASDGTLINARNESLDGTLRRCATPCGTPSQPAVPVLCAQQTSPNSPSPQAGYMTVGGAWWRPPEAA